MLRRICLISALLVAAPSAMASEFVVVESSSQLHSLGKMISGQIEVKSGERVTLMDASGNMHRLEGPFSGAVTAARASNVGALKAVSRLLADNATDTSTLGAIRQVPRAAGGEGAISAELAGDQCVTGTQNLKVWRAEIAAAESAELRQVNGTSGRVIWAKGEAVAPWPEAVPVVLGAPYLLRRDGATIPHKLVLHQVPSSLSPGERIGGMVDAGCLAQARAALAQVLQGD